MLDGASRDECTLAVRGLYLLWKSRHVGLLGQWTFCAQLLSDLHHKPKPPIPE